MSKREPRKSTIKKFKTKFPASKIKKIMHSNEEIGKVSNISIALVSISAELFLKDLIENSTTTVKERKILNVDSLINCIETNQNFDFLIPIAKKFRKKQLNSQKEKEKEKQNNKRRKTNNHNSSKQNSNSLTKEKKN
ncbi:dr1-associated corepressor [Anaeramoeba flamelloides]|uniref:Dr1-associated corepressor n=1 Tax=Anaeramoeba flamelloides TaxID=1746091 RepID=A0ABQ8X1A4_9EUKA|nr:dr1-associated corepressor [Anaeramoeba flamelloides]